MNSDGDCGLTYPARLRGLSIPLARGVPHISGGWSVLLESRVIGHGAEEFGRARERIRSWQMHRDAGMVVDAHADADVGVQVALQIGLAAIAIRAECQVVAVVDEPAMSGFAYGTLPRHPERGEEAFLVRLLDDEVVGSVAAFSRPARWYTQAGGPVTRAVQAFAARRYLDAMLTKC